MLDIFYRGGPIMWPLLLTSIISLSVIIERIVFVISNKLKRKQQNSATIIELAKEKAYPEILSRYSSSEDYIVKVLLAGIKNPDSFKLPMQQAANKVLSKFNRGVSLLDTAITLAPLLGLLGTVVGMINAFHFIGGSELGAPSAITGGIAEALIATAFGLGIAIFNLIPFNFLNSYIEIVREELEESASQLELVLNTNSK